MKPRSSPSAPVRGPRPSDGPIRLDLITNPYGLSIRAQEALASADDLHLPQPERACRVRSRLAAVAGIPPSWLVLANGIDELLRMILLWRMGRGPVVTFPPTEPEAERRAWLCGHDVVAMPRSHRFSLDLDRERSTRIPPRSTALVMSPNDPTGTLLSTQDAVRLSRRCEMVIVDERHGQYSGRSLVPLVREFDNLIAIHTLETWAALSGLPVAYAIAPPHIAEQLAAYAPINGVAAGALIAAEATLDDLAFMRATAQRVTEEKSRLYRMLRKLNMISPLSSWANFLLGRIERGDAGCIHRELARRDIHVFRPHQPEMNGYLRISATRPEHTDALKRALIEIALDL